MILTQLYEIFRSADSINTDSRTIRRGQIYWALKGEHFDGNDFIQSALEAGAEWVVSDRPSISGDKIITVENSLQTLQALARHHRNQFDIPVIAITGSNGKTTTKELLATCLQTTYKIHYTRGNLNNHLGVPLTLLLMPTDTEVAIIEMGANHIGEIGALCEIALPTQGVITNIAPAHLEGFGSIEGVYLAKSELYQFLSSHNGTIFVNAEEKTLSPFITKFVYAQLYNSNFKNGDEISSISTVMADPFLSFVIDGKKYQTLLAGLYNFNNILTALSVALSNGVDLHTSAEALCEYLPENNRSQWIKHKDIEILLDAYNANPVSMKSAIENFHQLTGNSKFLILGDMKELGTSSKELHSEVLQMISRIGGWTDVTLIGPDFYNLRLEFPVYHFFERRTDFNPDWDSMRQSKLLIKGSRDLKLELLLDETDAMP